MREGRCPLAPRMCLVRWRWHNQPWSLPAGPYILCKISMLSLSAQAGQGASVCVCEREREREREREMCVEARGEELGTSSAELVG